jgi:hypothetical protein
MSLNPAFQQRRMPGNKANVKNVRVINAIKTSLLFFLNLFINLEILLSSHFYFILLLYKKIEFYLNSYFVVYLFYFICHLKKKKQFCLFPKTSSRFNFSSPLPPLSFHPHTSCELRCELSELDLNVRVSSCAYAM